MIQRLFVILTVIGLAACARGHCRRAAPTLEPAKPVDSVGAEPLAPSKPLADERVFVFKYDGSLQCGMGKAISPDVMAKELKGIEVFSKAKKKDGLMHIQVCGSITGSANVFEIPAKSLKAAEAEGFKKWEF